jgi:Domain of Unknown Function with PDB structure (DUF3857)/Transglutaminase-like superfamily
MTRMGWWRIVPPGMLLLGIAVSLAMPRCLAATVESRIMFDQATSIWTVAADGTWMIDAEVTIRAPKLNPSHVVLMPLTWSASTEQLTVVQMRIDKQDGRSIVMGKEIIRNDPPTGDAHFHEFSDQRRLLVTFPDAEPGDLLVVRTHREVFRPRVPGGFMAAPVLGQSSEWGETNFTISVPADVPFHYEVRGFDHQSEPIKDRTMHYLHSPKPSTTPLDPAVLGEFDRLPRFAVSTFRDWNAFSKAYASVLLPHARVTPAIAATAARLTESERDQLAQSRVLYEWVRDHVEYVPVPLEESRPDPNDAENVLMRLYGDQKDHAVLLYALLASKGIPAEIVLLNAANDATIADPPNIRPMDHLILFLPKLNLYVDSTLKVAPFGVLPFGELGKPAIHLGELGYPRRTVPMPPSGSTWAELKTDATLDDDGTVSGTTTTTARGAFGIWLRTAALNFGENGQAAATTLLRRNGTPGTGTFSFDPPTMSDDDYAVHGTFRLEKQSALLNGGFFALWTGLRILPRPGDVLGGPMFLPDSFRTDPTFCYPGIESEQISLTLPPDRHLGALPPDTKIDSELVRFRSHWSLSGQRVSVSREFQSLLSGPVCEGRLRQEMADVLPKVRADLLNSVGIRQDQAPAPPDSVDDPATEK